MREACRHCGSDEGIVYTKGGQDVVRCESCSRFAYNQPKTESGRATRSLQTTHKAIKPKLRMRVIERAGGVCECCRRAETSSVGLHVGHVISVEDGHRHGLSDEQINSLENLIAQCPECNLGAGSETMPIRTYIAILMLRIRTEKQRGTV